MTHVWSDFKGLTLTYVDNDLGQAYLYDRGLLIGGINLGSWCKTHNASIDIVLSNPSEYEDLMKDAVFKIVSDDGRIDKKAEAIMELRNLQKYVALVLALHDYGMEPLPIALRTGVPFIEVMDILSTLYPSVELPRIDRIRDEMPDHKMEHNECDSKT